MDVQMPEMDGLEATRRIRDPHTGVRNPRIPIVAMTAHAMKGDRERCLEAGMDDYVSKPISPQEVANAISRWLPSDPPADQPQPGQAEPALDAGERAGSAQSGLPDRAALLNRLGGDEEVFVEVIKIFLEDVPNVLAGMDRALAARDAKTLRRLAHTLKGSSGTAGAEALQLASLRLEEAAAAGDFDAAAPLIPPVKELFAEVLDTMGRWVSGEPVS
jgi:HPt (histidine-containing phosphotransfer) domain-containing protein